MFVVALFQVAGDLEAEVPVLAGALDATPYDARRILTANKPTLVLTTSDQGRASAVARALEQRRHSVAVADTDTVVSSSDMVPLRAFVLGDRAIERTAAPAATPDPDRLDYDDIAALVRATHRTQTERLTPAHELPGVAGSESHGQYDPTPGEAVREDVPEPVLYIFRRSGSVPWILRATKAHYPKGPELRATRFENFLQTVGVLRARARFAAYDDRLVKASHWEGPPADRSWLADRSGAETRRVDLFAHLLALWLPASRGPYRG